MTKWLMNLDMSVVVVAFFICLAVVVYIARRVAIIKTYLQEADKCYWRAKECADESESREVYAEMLAQYNKAVSLGSAEALTRLGHAYREGWGVKPDMQKAFYYYNRAAKKSFHEAQYHLSLLYENGQGVEQNLKKAAHWKKRSQTTRLRLGF